MAVFSDDVLRLKRDLLTNAIKIKRVKVKRNWSSTERQKSSRSK